MNEVVLDDSIFKLPDFFKSEITLKSIQSDPGDNDGKHFDTNEPWVI